LKKLKKKKKKKKKNKINYKNMRVLFKELVVNVGHP
jgi:hypothetical protein